MKKYAFYRNVITDVTIVHFKDHNNWCATASFRDACISVMFNDAQYMSLAHCRW